MCCVVVVSFVGVYVCVMCDGVVDVLCDGVMCGECCVLRVVCCVLCVAAAVAVAVVIVVVVLCAYYVCWLARVVLAPRASMSCIGNCQQARITPSLIIPFVTFKP